MSVLPAEATPSASRTPAQQAKRVNDRGRRGSRAGKSRGSKVEQVEGMKFAGLEVGRKKKSGSPHKRGPDKSWCEEVRRAPGTGQLDAG